MAPAFHGSRASLFAFWAEGDHAIVARLYRRSRASWFARIVVRILGRGRPCNRSSRVSQLARILVRVDHCSQIIVGSRFGMWGAIQSKPACIAGRVHLGSRASVRGGKLSNCAVRASYFARSIAVVLGVKQGNQTSRFSQPVTTRDREHPCPHMGVGGAMHS